jgi:HK97 family phage prohead protease
MQVSVPLEIKSVGAREFTGYGSVFNNVDFGGDVVAPGAFDASLKEFKAEGTMPLMFWMHRADQVPGVWLNMAEDKSGLFVHGEVLDTSLGRDVRTLLEKKAVRGLSIGFRPEEVAWRGDTRILQKVKLFEVSIVSMAMNPLAKVEALKARLSALGEYVPTERELEEYLRKLGCSKNVSRTLIAKLSLDLDPMGGMPNGDRWDAGTEGDEEMELLKLANSLLDTVGAASMR